MSDVRQLNINQLTAHPINAQIYGKTIKDDEWIEFVASIKRHGVMDPIFVDENYMILSGHRRVEAVEQIGLETIPGYVVKLSNESQKIAFLLEKNRYRTKTNAQRIREAKTYEANISLMAKVNMQHKGTDETTKIVTRDALGEIAGMSGSSFDRGKKVVEKIDNLKEEGKEEEAKKLEEKLNASIFGAANEISSKKKKPMPTAPPDPDYWFDDDLSKLVETMEKLASRMSSRRRSNTPAAFSWFLYNIQEDAKQYRRWLSNHSEKDDCPVCQGTMFVDGSDCRNCISGKVGPYRILELDIPGEDLIKSTLDAGVKIIPD